MAKEWYQQNSHKWQTWPPMRKKLATVNAHGELMVSSWWPKWSQPAVTEPWTGPWLSCDLALTEPWSYWRCRDWAVTSPWLSCDLAVTEQWPRLDWAVTSPSRDWTVIIGPRSHDHRGHCELMVSSRWPFIFSWAPLTVGLPVTSDRRGIELVFKSLDCFTKRLFHSASIRICCLKLHQADYQVEEVFFARFGGGALSSNVLFAPYTNL